MPDEPVSVACPHCSVRLKLKDSSAVGKTIKCPKCAQSFTAVVAAPAAAAAVTSGAPTKKKRPPPDESSPEDESDEGDEPADDAPRKKKKKKGKKKRKKQASGPPLPLILGISAFVFLLIAGGVVAAIVINKGGSGGSRGAAAVAPPELEQYNGPTYSMLAPKGWKKVAEGAENHQWVEFTSGPVMVRGQDDSAGVGDILSGAGRGVKMDDHTQEVIHGVHLGKGETLAEELDDYKESEPVPYTCKMGMARWSEYSYTEGFLFKTKIKGIRATVQSGTRTLIMRCTCPESMFETFKPIFVKIVTSAGPGVRA